MMHREPAPSHRPQPALLHDLPEDLCTLALLFPEGRLLAWQPPRERRYGRPPASRSG